MTSNPQACERRFRPSDLPEIAVGLAPYAKGGNVRDRDVGGRHELGNLPHCVRSPLRSHRGRVSRQFCHTLPLAFRRAATCGSTSSSTATLATYPRSGLARPRRPSSASAGSPASGLPGGRKGPVDGCAFGCGLRLRNRCCLVGSLNTAAPPASHKALTSAPFGTRTGSLRRDCTRWSVLRLAMACRYRPQPPCPDGAVHQVKSPVVRRVVSTVSDARVGNRLSTGSVSKFDAPGPRSRLMDLA
jgi:hypothetical protein